MQGAVYPEYPFSPAEMRHEDSTWDRAKHFLWRAVIDGVGWVQLNHSSSAFVADTYWLDLGVIPAARRRGHGTALYEAALRIARERGAARLRGGTKESMPDGPAFLRRRGWVETKRDWESRLSLKEFDRSRFAGARDRVTSQGVRISTLADELARDPDAARRAFELHAAARRDVPSPDPPTPQDETTWRRRRLEGPNALPEAFFLAIDADGRYLAMSELERSDDDPTFLWQGFTGVLREARGRGLAMALKLETVEYGLARGIDHIKTWNDQSNRPMLRINEALGFEKQPAWITFHKDLAPASK